MCLNLNTHARLTLVCCQDKPKPNHVYIYCILVKYRDNGNDCYMRCVEEGGRIDKVQGTRRVKKTKFKKFDIYYIWKVIPLSGREFHGEFIFHKINSTGCPIFAIYLFRDIVFLTDLRSMNN